MAKLRREAIRLINLWRDFGPNTPRLDLEMLFHEAVLPCSNGDTCIIIREPFDSFEGLTARKEGEQDWRIGVSTNIGYEPRRHFTLAHEIAHFIGHRYVRDVFQCTFENLNDFQTNGLEFEANDFAANLLMPADTIRRYDKKEVFGHDAISELASMLGVSRAAAAYRWIELTDRHIGFAISRDGFINHGRASKKLYARGVFFRPGDEVPTGSLIGRLDGEGQELNDIVPPPVWHQQMPCRESSFATTQGGYIYSYLDFR